MSEIHAMNGVKTLLGSTANLIAIFAFNLGRKGHLAAGTCHGRGIDVGGYGGAYFARKVNPKLIRSLVIFVGAADDGLFLLAGLRTAPRRSAGLKV